MFGFLKDKLKKAISRFTKDVEEEVEEKVEEPVKEEKKKEALKKAEQHKEKIIVKEEKKKEVLPKKKDDAQTKKHEKYGPEKSEEVKKPSQQKPIVVEKEETRIEKEIPKIIETRKVHAPIEEKKGFFGKIFSKKTEEPKITQQETVSEKPLVKQEIIEKSKEESEEKKGFFEKLQEVVTKKTLSDAKFEELFFELELAMLENNVAVEVIEKIKEDMKKNLLSEKVSRVKTEVIVAESLKKSVEELFDIDKIYLLKEAKKNKPYIICFIGVNGSGKTTNLAKVANYLQKNGLSVVIAACDTFRAAAIQQIEEHANRLGVKLIKHDYGADAAAVAYDAIEHAKAKGKDVVLIDTAGRSHANTNLMDELEKVVRVSKPNLKIFVGDSLTGNDTVEQAKTFNEKVGIDGIILSKVDVDEKGGAAISVSYITKKPIMFIGTGQTYDDLEEFDKNKIIKNLGF